MVFFKLMNSLRFLLPVVAVTLLPFSAQAQETALQSEPFGYVKVNITAGTGSAKRTTLVSIPLLEEAAINGATTGRITAVGSNTITAAGAGWTPGELSAAASPYLLEITSGDEAGRMLLLSTSTNSVNTTDTVTVDAAEIARVGDLRGLRITAGAENGHTYKIRPVDTLSSFFGTPDTTLVQGGTAAASADTIKLTVNGSVTTHFFNTSLGRWTTVTLGSPDASHVRIPPHAGLQYERLPSSPLNFIVTGRVPAGQRQVPVKNSGPTILSSYWPVGLTLADLGLQELSGWVTGSSTQTADTILMTSGGSAQTYFHDGSTWRRTGLGGGVADTASVPAGASILINKRGSAGGFTDYQQAAPYNIQ
jgi:hypothetical protein